MEKIIKPEKEQPTRIEGRGKYMPYSGSTFTPDEMGSEPSNPILEAKEMTASELDDHCKELHRLYAEKAKISSALKEVNKKIASKEFYLADVFSALGKTENSGSWGKVVLKRIRSFRVVDMEPLKKYMQKLKVWDDMAKIHHGTLGAWIKDQVTAKRQEDTAQKYWLPEGVVEEEVVRCQIKKGDK